MDGRASGAVLGDLAIPARAERHSLWREATRRFRRHRLAMFGAAILLVKIHFTDDSFLAIELLQQRLAVALIRGSGDAIGEGLNDDPQPTRRQRDYLEFIARYIRRFGVSPAESDIGRHFLVSAPSVNQMVQTLERRGFITRQRGAPRSISIVHHADQLLPQHQPASVSDPRPNLAVHRTGARVARAGR